MRASTMFALIVAVLLGLGVAVGAKASGLLSRAEPKKEVPPPMVLAAAANLFEGTCLQAADVRLRPIMPEEMEAFRKGELLPAMTQAAVRRFAKVNIPADAALRKDFLEDMAAPLTIKDRLAPGMNAINVALPKAHCAGGMINVGDWVNVQLITNVETPEGGMTTASAVIARNVRVVAKRNSLWPVAQPLAFDAPMNFTLETNPYRAALVEFSKQKGQLVLVPISESDRRVLEARRLEMLNGSGVQQVSFSVPESPEYRDEDVRVAAFNEGAYAISDADLMRIYNLKMEKQPEPPVTAIEVWSGVRRAGEVVFGGPGGTQVPPSGPSVGRNSGVQRAALSTPQTNLATANPAGGSFRFTPPPPDCPTCRTGKR
ncbi:MAG TPA: RcpC/CpaB family pilus assembly protein [Gemmatales bacterium]|nr:RcpC/CpaB family pilus assembly protein [Gemmatales bacterium]HMP59310.1 RcpC/CpaB family pilus assembly protein [Gemmatales bacterium]